MKRLTKKGNGQFKIRLSGRSLKQLKHAARKSTNAKVRERAKAILNLYLGMSVQEVADYVGCHRSTIYNWLHEYFDHSIHVWTQPRQRRAKVSETELEELIKTVLKKTPQDLGAEQTRWTLALLREKLPFLKRYRSLSGIWYLLRRALLSWTRYRCYTPSTDPRADYKIRRNRRILGYARQYPHKAVMLFLDEYTLKHHPPGGAMWGKQGVQPDVERGRKREQKRRIVGAVDAVSGRLIYHHNTKIGVKTLCQFLTHLRNQYPDRRLYLVLDNWHNVHDHPRTIQHMKDLKIHYLFQPTYMPQSNPIERVWWHLNETLLRAHRFKDDFAQLQDRVWKWFDTFKEGSSEMIQMIGLNASPAIRMEP